MIAVLLPLDESDRDDVARLAEEFSPRIECGAFGVALDASGLTRLFGGAEGLARELARQAASRGLSVRVAIAATRTAAALVNGDGSHFYASRKNETRPHFLVVPPGDEAAVLAPLPLERLSVIAPKPRKKRSTDQQIDQLLRWGVVTLGDLAALPASELSSRMGEAGLVLQRAARGEDERPLIPATTAASFMQSMQLEWPVDDLQPLAFIVARLCDGLEQALARADRGAVTLTTMLRLVTREAYARTLALPSPMRDARVLRTLVMLDLESHPPGAAIDEVIIDVDVAPGRILQTGLFEPALPAPEVLSTLVARLGAVAGTSRVGAPALLDTHAPGAFAMRSFAPHQAQDSGLRARDVRDNARASIASGPEPWARSPEPFVSSVIRRFRPPRAARVKVGSPGGVQGTPRQLCPMRIDAEDISGEVVTAAGPWRSAGGWWQSGWDRDEWDVALENGLTCRVAQDRITKSWVVDGVLD